MQNSNNTGNSGVGQNEDIDQEGDKPKEGEDDEMLNFEFNTVLSTNDLNDCATLYQSILNLKESASEEEMKSATDNFQANLAEIITKYHRAAQPTGDIPQQMSRILGRKELLFMSNERILEFLDPDSVISKILQEILNTDKSFFGELYELFEKLITQHQSTVTGLQQEISELQNRLQEVPDNTSPELHISSSLPPSSSSGGEPDPEKELLKKKIADYELLYGRVDEDKQEPPSVIDVGGEGGKQGVVKNSSLSHFTKRSVELNYSGSFSSDPTTTTTTSSTQTSTNVISKSTSTEEAQTTSVVPATGTTALSPLITIGTATTSTQTTVSPTTPTSTTATQTTAPTIETTTAAPTATTSPTITTTTTSLTSPVATTKTVTNISSSPIATTASTTTSPTTTTAISSGGGVGVKPHNRKYAFSPPSTTTGVGSTTPHYMTPKSSKNTLLSITAATASPSYLSSSSSSPLTASSSALSTKLRKAAICIPQEELELGTNKYLTLHQLEEIIEEIYRGKAKHDAIMKENRLPKETLAQYLFTYYEKKVGLRNLVEDNLNALLFYTQKYIPVSNEVAVFAALVNNQIDEEFRYVQKQLRETLEQLIHAFLRGKFHHESEKQIYERKQHRLRGGRVAEDEWMSAIKFMYNDKDVEKLTPLIINSIEKERVMLENLFSHHKLARSEKKSIPTPQIAYPDLLKIILDFHLANHRAYLLPFNTFFSSAQKESISTSIIITNDNNNNNNNNTNNNNFTTTTTTTTITPGVLNEKGFRLLYDLLHENLGNKKKKKKKKERGDEEKKEIEKLLNLVDPFSTKVIIYADCVRAFADDIEQYNQEKQEDI